MDPLNYVEFNFYILIIVVANGLFGLIKID